jgi:hypothetical protein
MEALKPNQIKAAILLVSGKSAKDVASAIDCTPESITHWKKNPDFEALLNQLRMDLIKDGRELIRGSIEAAVETLQDLMSNSDQDEVRRKTAMNILTMNGLTGNVEDSKFRITWGIGMTTAEGVLKEQKYYAKYD